MIMMMMMMMTMMTNTIPYRRTKTHKWDKVLMGFWVHPLTIIMLMINIIGHYHQVVLMVIMTILKLPQHFCFRRNSQLVTLYYLPLRASLPYQGFPSHLHGHIIVMFGLVNIGVNIAIRPKPKQGQKNCTNHSNRYSESDIP